jgi:O-antigen/teichoic acid export membrane protein
MGTLGGHACHLAVTILVMKTLGPDQYGLLAFALTIQGALCTLGGLGLRQVVVREAVRCPQDISRVLSAYLVLTVGAWATLSLGCLVWLLSVGAGYSAFALAGVLMVGGLASCATLQPFVDARGLQTPYAVASFGVEVLALVVVAASSTAGWLSLEFAGVMVALKLLAVWVIGAVQLWLRELRFAFSFDGKCARELLRSAGPLFGVAALGLLPGTLVALVLEGSAGSTEFALFAVGAQVSSAYLLLVAAGVRVLQPEFVPTRESGVREFRGLLFGHGGLMILALVGVFGAGAVLTYCILDPFYRSAVVSMGVLLVAAFFNGVGLTAVAWLVSVGASGAAFRGQVVNTGITVLGCWVLRSDLTALGAAVVFCVASAGGTAVLLMGVWGLARRGSTLNTPVEDH